MTSNRFRDADTVRVSTLYTNVEAEETVASGLLCDTGEIDQRDLLNRFSEKQFASSPLARWIYRACASLNADGGPFNYETVSDFIRRSTTAITPSQVVSCAGSFRGAASVESASVVVEESHRRRTLLKISEYLLSKAVSSDASELALDVRQKIDEILNDGKAESYDLSGLVNAISDRLDKPEKQAKPRSTGLCRLDWILNGGFRPGRLVVVGARSSHGKTAFGVGNLALAAAERGFSVLIITLEMTPDELAARFLTSAGGVPVEEIIASRISPSNMRGFTRGAATLSRLNVKIIPPRNRKLSNLVRIIRQSVRRDGAQIVFIDYLQLIRHDHGNMKRYEAVAEISGEIKALSQEMNVPIVVLAQLNREADGETPRSAHLRESGAIEQDADEILLIHRPDGDDGIPQDFGWIIVDKNRNGRRGRVAVQFVGDRCAFTETDQEPQVTKKGKSR